MAYKDPQAKKAYQRQHYLKNKEKIAARYWETREKLNQLKLATGCARCGFNAHPAALDYNHIDPATKSFSVTNVDRGWERVQEEIAKCELLCANCHRIHSHDNNHYHVRR
jgi:hypothetical protein